MGAWLHERARITEPRSGLGFVQRSSSHLSQKFFAEERERQES